MVDSPPENKQSELQLARLANLLLLQSRLRDIPTELELGFCAVNDSLSLVDAASAFLWRVPPGEEFSAGEVFAVSSSALPEKNTAFSQWSKTFCKTLHDCYGSTQCVVNSGDLSDELNTQTQALLPKEALWLPLEFNGRMLGALVVMRRLPWTDSELRIMQQWSGAVSHAWNALQKTSTSFSLGALSKLKGSRIALIGIAALVLSLIIPVRLSVLAPAELKSGDSYVVRSPIQGVIDQLHVEANSPVSSGDRLVSLDDTALKTELEVAQQELEIARAQYRQSTQAAAFSDEASASLQIQRITLEKVIAQVNYLTDLVSRTQVTAPENGTVIIENIDEFVGRPIQLGERLLLIVDDNNLELELWLPVGDDIELPLGSEVDFFPNAAAVSVYTGRLESLDYEAQLSPLGTLAYRARASIEFPDNTFSRIGMRGTGKLYGTQVSLFYFVFRRPIAFFRQSVGL